MTIDKLIERMQSIAATMPLPPNNPEIIVTTCEVARTIKDQLETAEPIERRDCATMGFSLPRLYGVELVALETPLEAFMQAMALAAEGKRVAVITAGKVDA